MKVISLTKRKLKRLPLLALDKNIVNKEAKLYIHDFKKEYTHHQDLLKIYNNQNSSYIAGKITVISKLIANFEYLNIPELVLPTSLVSLDGEISGFAMPLIEKNINLSLILNNPSILLEEKIRWLKEILNLLIKLKEARQLEKNFYLGDIHEANFILDLKDNRVKAVDLDSSYFPGCPIPISKYTTLNALLEEFPNKYTLDEDSGKFIPCETLTSASFIYMLLNILSGCINSHHWSYNEFYHYISFLEKNNFPKELLDIIANLYTAGKIDIDNPTLLDGIDTKKDYTISRARIHKSSDGYYHD